MLEKTEIKTVTYKYKDWFILNSLFNRAFWNTHRKSTKVNDKNRHTFIPPINKIQGKTD